MEVNESPLDAIFTEMGGNNSTCHVVHSLASQLMVHFAVLGTDANETISFVGMEHQLGILCSLVPDALLFALPWKLPEECLPSFFWYAAKNRVLPFLQHYLARWKQFDELQSKHICKALGPIIPRLVGVEKPTEGWENLHAMLAKSPLDSRIVEAFTIEIVGELQSLK